MNCDLEAVFDGPGGRVWRRPAFVGEDGVVYAVDDAGIIFPARDGRRRHNFRSPENDFEPWELVDIAVPQPLSMIPSSGVRALVRLNYDKGASEETELPVVGWMLRRDVVVEVYPIILWSDGESGAQVPLPEGDTDWPDNAEIVEYRT